MKEWNELTYDEKIQWIRMFGFALEDFARRKKHGR